ncbi:GNAT family acetyltransferase [Dyella thiooxydans]|jgi:GNAT superfamily N-acetyltransferase|uniref:GNAT family acetyltransferase n=1 Tax=Dyella thiooxydans TaxID=445710 RepID=A0A161IVE0_9GAMM|nr:GNAT family N-acetyltransferase [Dyella thiooxydans]AND69089.1 GNAT family acetyltransferase [Dyella thiooxydans]
MDGTLRIDTSREALDRDMIHAFLAEQAYWSRGIPRETVERAIEGSLCFGGYLDGRQIAFARVVTDGATFGYLADVFVLPQYRGHGYAKALMAAVMAHPQLQGLRRFSLATSDAHTLYAGFGFTAPSRPQNLMEKLDPDIYTRQPGRP